MTAGRKAGEYEVPGSLRDTQQMPACQPKSDAQVANLPDDTFGPLEGYARFDAAASRDRFEQQARLNPNREVGLVYNVRTREYMVIQG